MTADPGVRPASLWSELRLLPRSYWILFSGTLINRFGHFVMPFLALYLRSEGYAGWVTGASLTSYGAGTLLANLAGGYFADRVGRKPTILVSCAGAVVTMLALSQAQTPLMLILLSGIVGLVSAVYFPAASALLADLVPAPLRIRAFGCQRLATNLGFALGMATAGLLAAHSFLLLFVIDAATTAVLGLMVLIGVRPGNPPKSDNPGWGIALAAMRRNGAYLRTVFASFCMAVVFWQLSSTWGLHITNIGGHAEDAYGWLMAINGIMIVAFELPLTSFTRLHPGPRMMALGFLLSGIGIGLSAFGGAIPLMIAVIVVFTIGEMISSPVAHSYVAAIAPDDMRGRFMGVLGVSWGSAAMVGPVAGIALFEYSPVLLWVASCLLGVLAAAVVFGIRPDRAT
ncbi:MFS transporter [Haloferula helveola]|uniref:MFS transporter n=1 Tax=Haloferula helveola TaxID=490095 RepID=A0ABM7RJB9_9BACT|nr:MFS transporter [Haloferula helveola]